jgi:hypothetical protein
MAYSEAKSKMAEGTDGASNSAVNLIANNEEKSKIMCICCAELELELEKLELN